MKRKVFLFTMLALVLVADLTAAPARAQAPAVDPAATKILKRTTDYVGSLKQFSVHTRTPSRTCLTRGKDPILMSRRT
jgi:hypothetical protein